MSPKQDAKKTTSKSKGFSDEERAAMKERAAELKAEARRGEGERRAREDRRDAGNGSRHGEAHLDDGVMWPTAFALKELTAATEARIGALVKKAVG